ncbi:MAG: fibronectin type III domain-containing protein [Bacillota bacterium]
MKELSTGKKISKEKILPVLLVVLAVLVLCVLPQFLFSKPSTVKGVEAAAVSYNTVSLSWNKADGAAEYHIYRSENGGPFKQVGTVKKTEFLDETVEPGEKYFYKVSASNLVNRSESKASASVTTILDTPAIHADVSKGDARIHINNISGAEGYTIFRNDEQYSFVDREEGKETVFIDDNAKSGVEYSYCVEADKGKAQSEKSEAASLELLAAGPITVRTEEDSLVFQWNGNEAYTSYKLYDGDKLLTETKEPVCKVELKEGTYDLKLTGYGDGLQSPEDHQVFRVEKDNGADEAATYLGQARNDIDKKPGDGSGREVCKSKFSYSSSGRFNWTYVFRPKDRSKANAAANMCEMAMKNNNIGYCRNGSKYGSHAADKLARAVDYDLSKITVRTGLSCGDLICLCNHYAGLSECYDGSGLGLSRKYRANSNFTTIRYKRGMKLLRGDVVITAHESGKQNHVAMCLTEAEYYDGVKITEVIIAKSR